MTIRTMLRRVSPVVTGLLLLTACGGGGGELVLDDARSRMSPMFTGVAAVYLDIDNSTDEDDRLLGVEVDGDVAASAELHETFDADDHDMGDGEMDDGDAAMDHGDMDGGTEPTDEGFAMMGMREIEALDIPAGETVELVPGGYHLMLIDLARDLEVGDEFDVTLRFESAGEHTVTVTVRDDI